MTQQKYLEEHLVQWSNSSGVDREHLAETVNNHFLEQGMYTTKGVDRVRGLSVSVCTSCVWREYVIENFVVCQDLVQQS